MEIGFGKDERGVKQSMSYDFACVNRENKEYSSYGDLKGEEKGNDEDGRDQPDCV